MFEEGDDRFVSLDGVSFYGRLTREHGPDDSDGPFSHGEEGPFGVPAYRPAVSRRRASASRASRAWSRSRREATTAAR